MTCADCGEAISGESWGSGLCEECWLAREDEADRKVDWQIEDMKERRLR